MAMLNDETWVELQIGEKMNGNILERRETRKSTTIKDNTTEQVVVVTKSTLALTPLSPTISRDLWTNKIEFLLSVIGYVVDLGNVWRFPYMCYENGGGAFLIPYMIFLCLIGIPMLYLELFLGQFYRCGNITLWGRIAPAMKGIGISSLLIVTAVTLFYTTIIAHALFYLISSFHEIMPWSVCGNSWNTRFCSERMRINYIHNETIEQVSFNETLLDNQDLQVSSAEEYYNIYMLGIDRSKGLTDLGYVKIDLLLCLITIFILMYICICRGVKGTGKAVYVTAVLPYIVLIILLIQGLSLQGSYAGITYFLKPTYAKLKDMKVWYSAANQIFFTLGPGLSVLTTYGSYNVSTNNCYYDALISVIANFAASFLAGFVVFSALGHMSYRLNKSITTVVGQGASLSFIAYPEILATFKYPTFFAILFFLMVINLGLDSDFGGLEAMYSALSDEYSLLKRHRKLGMFIMCCLLIIGCLPTVTYGGNYIVQFLDKFSTAPALMLVVMMEAIAATWVYGIDNLVHDIQTHLGFAPNYFFRVAWKILCPLIVMSLMVLSLTYSDELKYGEYLYPSWSIIFGWCLNMAFILPIPIVMMYEFIQHSDPKKSFKERIYLLFVPTITKRKLKQEADNKCEIVIPSLSPIYDV
ncbi:unnamed protein product [Adineta steineri]|uniref:Transporter n=1 Tax=Adineta steineri TaxID=433720 RepID=A0A815LW91_9BILA|nr:unnamed protein product [Adineta steineri]CAF3819613.1 unnamed protein product [Adineta steineri]